MLRKDVTAACLAPLAIALRCFAKGPNMVFSPRIFTFSGCHKVKALMGAADQWRHELQ
jgi:hypothetical protein